MPKSKSPKSPSYIKQTKTNSKIRPKIIDICMREAQDTSLVGLSKALDGNMSVLQRVFWVFVLAATVAFMTKLCVTVIAKYISNPTVMSLEMDYLNWNTSFPALTLCPYEKPDTILFEQLLRKLNTTSVSTYNFITNLLSITLETIEILYLEDNEIISPEEYASLVASALFNINSSTISTSLGFQLPAEAIMTEMGMCHVINANLPELRSRKDRQVSFYGENLELSFNDGGFFVQVTDYSSNYKVFIHSPNEIAQPTTVFFRQQKDRSSSINLLLKTTTSSKAVRNLPINIRRCRFFDEPLEPADVVYSYGRCLRDCRVKLIIALCACIPHFYRPTGNQRICKLTQLACVLKYKKELVSLTLPTNSDQSNLSAPAQLKYCNCYSNCEDTVYLIDNEQVDEVASTNRLRVVISRIPKFRYKRGVIVTPYDITNKLGGIINLCLGASVITIAELIIFFIIKPIIFIIESQYLKF